MGLSYYHHHRKALRAKAKAYQRQRRLANPEHVLQLERKWQLKRFGLTPEQYTQLLRKQNFVCAVCLRPETIQEWGKRLRALAVDHCHATKIVRGLLCGACNQALGLLKDDPIRISSLLRYLENSYGPK